jgi:ATP-dependent helicase HrpB
MQLLQWGIDDPTGLTWLDPPPRGAWLQSVDLLTRLGAIETIGAGMGLTPHGSLMVQLPLHPRLSHMLVTAASAGLLQTGCYLAAVLSDRDPFGRDEPDIDQRLALLTHQASCPPRYRGWLHRTDRLARQFEEQMVRLRIPLDKQVSVSAAQAAGFLLACAYPDRIGRRRHAGGWQLSNGRAANLAGPHPLDKQRWLAIAELGGTSKSKGDVIHSAAELDPELFDTALADLVEDREIADWDEKQKRFVAEAQRRVGELVLAKHRLAVVSPEIKRQAICGLLNRRGPDLLPWTGELRQWQARVMLMSVGEENKTTVNDEAQWPDVSDAALMASLDEWLGPYLDPVTQLSDLRKLDLKMILMSMLSWSQQQQLDKLLPVDYRVASGSRHRIDYLAPIPVLAVKLQEMFGMDETPAVRNGHVKLMVHLLSPAGRPLQITQDLRGFWRSSYVEVRKEMKGRYPKHPWPEDPVGAVATSRTKKYLD